ncbi:AAA family ATPase [Alloalcanivorax mobilis]|uniref:AAA family ATPase n=1 Tax=Alloalcanivorax mobilis TaxID=2019569 RepID=UPI000C76B59E|nr:AAA family ATPase [Alloalcanivorax mobilis]
MNYRFVVTGGPGGGKTTILTALAERGYSFAPESARRIIKERLAAGLSPRPEPVSFAHEILSTDIEKYRAVDTSVRPTFFDRGILDALYMLNAENALKHDEAARYIRNFPYNRVVFLLPPWEEIYGTDSERDQTFEQAAEVFEIMKRWYQKWGYETLEVPRSNVEERASFILEALDKQLTIRCS